MAKKKDKKTSAPQVRTEETGKTVLRTVNLPDLWTARGQRTAAKNRKVAAGIRTQKKIEEENAQLAKAKKRRKNAKALYSNFFRLCWKDELGL